LQTKFIDGQKRPSIFKFAFVILNKITILSFELYLGEGMRAEQKRKETKRFFGTQPKKNPSPGLMAQTSRADTGDFVGRFRRYW